MSKFENVTVVKAANVYFDGKVSSRTIEFANGEQKTLGLMLPGEYQFSTSQKEIMEILSGTVEVQLPGSQAWQTITGGESFTVEANAVFGIRVLTVTDYCCSYLN